MYYIEENKIKNNDNNLFTSFSVFNLKNINERSLG